MACLLCIAGCHSVESTRQTTHKASTSIPAKPHKARPKTAAPKAEADIEEKNLAQAFRDQNAPPNFPVTARTLAPFRRLKLGMTRREVITRVGMPDKMEGSGIYIDRYKLNDGSTVSLGSSGQLIYKVHTLKNGSSYDLIKANSSTPTGRR